MEAGPLLETVLSGCAKVLKWDEVSSELVVVDELQQFFILCWTINDQTPALQKLHTSLGGVRLGLLLVEKRKPTTVLSLGEAEWVLTPIQGTGSIAADSRSY
jgi:hypothetical protein